MSRLFEKYKKEILPTMMSDFGYTNVFSVPKIDKIVLNIGAGKTQENKKYLEDSLKLLGTVSGQKPVITKARQSVAGFKLKVGDKIGCKVTLRRKVMYEFLDRLISIVVPRFRDFRGLKSTSFDKSGNYSLGITEQSVFSEIEHDDIQFSLGMDVTIVINNGSPVGSYEMLKLFGMPFKSKTGDDDGA